MTEKKNGSQGQALVEFALILVLLLVLIFGIIEFGILMYDKAVLTHATREATRIAILYNAAPDPSDPDRWIYTPFEGIIKSKINDFARGSLITFGAPFDANAPGAVDILYRDVNGNSVSALDSREGEAEVRVRFRYTFLVLPRLAPFGYGTINLEARSVMRVE